MPSRNIIIGQEVDPALLERAKELRKNMTPEEGILWQHLRANRLGGWHFRRQQVIAGFIVDFYCHQAGLVVELDGPVHERQPEHDNERDTILESQGLRVLRIKNTEVHQDLELVLERILEACVQKD